MEDREELPAGGRFDFLLDGWGEFDGAVGVGVEAGVVKERSERGEVAADCGGFQVLGELADEVLDVVGGDRCGVAVAECLVGNPAPGSGRARRADNGAHPALAMRRLLQEHRACGA